jgi:hypothetical protein
VILLSKRTPDAYEKRMKHASLCRQDWNLRFPQACKTLMVIQLRTKRWRMRDVDKGIGDLDSRNLSDDRHRQRDSRCLLVQALALHSREVRVQGTGEAGEIAFYKIEEVLL